MSDTMQRKTLSDVIEHHFPDADHDMTERLKGFATEWGSRRARAEVCLMREAVDAHMSDREGSLREAIAGFTPPPRSA